MTPSRDLGYRPVRLIDGHRHRRGDGEISSMIVVDLLDRLRGVGHRRLDGAPTWRANLSGAFGSARRATSPSEATDREKATCRSRRRAPPRWWHEREQIGSGPCDPG